MEATKSAIKSYLTFRLGEETFAANVGKVLNILEMVKTQTHEWNFVDEGDHFLFDLILASKANYLVTGDKKVLELKLIENCHIVSPVEFLAGL